LDLLLLEHTLMRAVMAHPSYSKMRAMRQTAGDYRETQVNSQAILAKFGFEELGSSAAVEREEAAAVCASRRSGSAKHHRTGV
jgi:hypothetical protein